MTHKKTSLAIESIAQQSHELQKSVEMAWHLFPAFEPVPAPEILPLIRPGEGIPAEFLRIGRHVICATCHFYEDCECSDDDLVDGQCIALCKLCYCSESDSDSE